MGILKTRFERATDVPLLANAFVRGGRLARIVAAGTYAHKPRVEETAAATDRAIGAFAEDKTAGRDVTVTMSRALMLLTSSEPISVDQLVYPASGGRVQAFEGADTVTAGAVPFGHSWSAAPGADTLLWVKPLN